MKRMSNTYITGASMVALTFSLNITDANAASTCAAMPTCAEMGYTEYSCPNGIESLKCPFDKSKVKCISANCYNMGYTETQCATDEKALGCPYDTGKKMCIPDIGIASSECHVGDIYYSDGLCSSSRIRTKSPIGVVIDETRRIVVGLTELEEYWFVADGDANIGSGTGDFAETENQAKNTFNGERISNSCRSRSSCDMALPVFTCTSKTLGGQSWYLPSAGEWWLIEPNFDKINQALRLVGATPLYTNLEYWSTTMNPKTSHYCGYPEQDSENPSTTCHNFQYAGMPGEDSLNVEKSLTDMGATRCMFKY